MSSNIIGEEIHIPASEVKLDEDQGPLRMLTMQATPLTDQLRRGTKVRYKRRHYEVLEKGKPPEVTAAIVRLLLSPSEKEDAQKESSERGERHGHVH